MTDAGVAPGQVRSAPRWAVVAAYLVPLGVLPSAVWRLNLVFSGAVPVHAGGWYLVLLSLVSVTAALLTLGLVQPWGEVLPRWVPLVGGRTIPLRAAVVPAVTGVVLINGIFAYGLLNMLFHFVERGPVLIRAGSEEMVGPPAGWVLALYAPMLAWGPLLTVVTVAYYRRRTQTQRGHGNTAVIRSRDAD